MCVVIYVYTYTHTCTLCVYKCNHICIYVVYAVISNCELRLVYALVYVAAHLEAVMTCC